MKRKEKKSFEKKNLSQAKIAALEQVVYYVVYPHLLPSKTAQLNVDYFAPVYFRSTTGRYPISRFQHQQN